MEGIISIQNLPNVLYVELAEKDQLKLWQKLQGSSIKVLAEKIKISVRNLYKYKEGNSGYPIQVLRELVKLADFEPKKVTLKTRRASEPIKDCRLPIKFDEHFAEFLGYLMGDGGIDSQFRVHFTTDRLEDINKFKKLVKRIFGSIRVQFKDYKTRYTIYYPKTLGLLLTKTVGLTKGSKVDSDLAIPSGLLPKFDVSSKIKFIRAFYESDGFTDEIGIGQAGKDLENPPTILVQIKEFLQSLGFNSVYIRRSTNYETPKTKKLRSRWVLKIGSKEEKDRFISIIAPKKLKSR